MHLNSIASVFISCNSQVVIIAAIKLKPRSKYVNDTFYTIIHFELETSFVTFQYFVRPYRCWGAHSSAPIIVLYDYSYEVDFV